MKMTKQEREFFYGPTPEKEPQATVPATTKRGWVKFWNCDSGTGTLEQFDGGPSLYFHASGCIGRGFKSFTRGQFVEYAIGVNRRGPIAFSVRPLRPDEVGGGRDDRPSGQNA
jgi:cold shock CspA family protein